MLTSKAAQMTSHAFFLVFYFVSVGLCLLATLNTFPTHEHAWSKWATILLPLAYFLSKATTDLEPLDCSLLCTYMRAWFLETCAVAL